jgi:hypothetical protein
VKFPFVNVVPLTGRRFINQVTLSSIIYSVNGGKSSSGWKCPAGYWIFLKKLSIIDGIMLEKLSG